jgi:hypothetical protein
MVEIFEICSIEEGKAKMPESKRLLTNVEHVYRQLLVSSESCNFEVKFLTKESNLTLMSTDNKVGQLQNRKQQKHLDRTRRCEKI